MGWVTPLFLAGLAAVAIPVIIHLLPNRRQTVETLGTNRFLRLAMRQGRRNLRLKNLLLLLSRMAIVSLLALLFARPFLAEGLPDAEKEGETLVLLDVSGSMDFQMLDVSHAMLAREQAERIVDNLPEGGKVTSAVFGKKVVALDDFGECKLLPGVGTDFAAALRWARDRLDLSEKPYKHLVLVSDLQKSGIPEKQVETRGLDIGVELVKTQAYGTWNAQVSFVRPQTPVYTEEKLIEVGLTVYGHPSEAQAALIVSFDHGQSMSRTVPLETGIVSFYLPMEKPGMLKGVAELEVKDPYVTDNRRFFAFAIKPPVKVLLVDGTPGRKHYEQDAYFLDAALKVTKKNKDVSPYLPCRSRELDDLSDTRIVALCNVASLSADDMEKLALFVSSGGSLIYFLGDSVDVDAYRRITAAGLFPGSLDRLPSGADLFREDSPILEWDASHRALRAFKNRDMGDLSRIRFRGAFSIQTRHKVLARLSNREPAIVEGALGKGRIIVVSNPCNRRWGDWPQERIFLPLIRELFAYLVGRTDSAGEEGTPREVAAMPVDLEDGRPPGIYGADPMVIINPDNAEGVPGALTEAEFRKHFGLPEPVIKKQGASESEEGLHENRERNRELWRYLAVALLVCLFAENYLADRG